MGAQVEHFISNGTWSKDREKLKTSAYVAGLQFNFLWTPEEKALFRQLWREERGLMYICNKLNREWIEVTVLTADMDNRGTLPDRERSLFGWIGVRSCCMNKHGYMRTIAAFVHITI